ncbi:uncharacterized protein LOC105766932 [Gossypium raimondii]|uniref:uncharacterized protein LOC105766932 n=1 Tax=Gossypium raimondii TaxID=29730 RepID=UPI00063ACF9B|nr:uncharacterized protein LOC105766932 [Gossypium raimondii]
MSRKRWHPPVTGWVKINVNGSVSRNNSRAIIGGVLRGPSEGWLVGFRMRTAISNIAEIRLILELCSKDWQIKFRHISRDSNKVANQLAKMDEDKINCSVTLKDPPLFVHDLLEKDIYNSSMDES